MKSHLIYARSAFENPEVDNKKAQEKQEGGFGSSAVAGGSSLAWRSGSNAVAVELEMLLFGACNVQSFVRSQEEKLERMHQHAKYH